MASELRSRSKRRRLIGGVLAINEMDNFLIRPLDDRNRWILLIYFSSSWVADVNKLSQVARYFNMSVEDVVEIQNNVLVPGDGDSKDGREIFLTLALDPEKRGDNEFNSFTSGIAALMRSRGPDIDAIQKEVAAGNIDGYKYIHHHRGRFDVELAVAHNIIEALTRKTFEQQYQRLRELKLAPEEIYRRLTQLEE